MLRSLTLIRPDERRNAFGAFLTLFGLMSAHALLETARDALFLAHLPPSRLPWTYLAIAAVALALSAIRSDSPSRLRGRAELSAWIVASAIVTLAFWTHKSMEDDWILYALYVWTGVFATLIVVRFWTLIGDTFTVTQAKRLFALIGTGSVLGAIAGSGIAQVVAARFEARHMLVAAAALLLASALAPSLIREPPSVAGTSGARGARTSPPSPNLAAALSSGLRRRATPFDLVWSNPYTKRLALLVIVSTIAITIVDFVFKSMLARTVSPAQLGYVFATAYFVLNILSLLAQILLVGLLTRTLGVSRVLALLPVLLFFGSAWLLFGGGIYAVLLTKGFDGSLRHSLHRTATEILFVPLSPDFRARAKGFIDVVGQRGGQAVASVAILAAVATGRVDVVLGVVIVVLAVVWIAIARDLKGHYLDLFRTTLGERTAQTRIAFPSLDMASLESLIAALSSQNDAEVIAAMDLLAEKERARLIPALILYHPSAGIVVHALETMSRERRDDALPIARRLLRHANPDVRAEALRMLAETSIEDSILEEALADPSPRVSITARVCLAANTPDSEIPLTLLALAATGTLEEKLALAHAIRHKPSALFENALLALAESADAGVRLEVARAMKAMPAECFLPRLLAMLPQREVRAAVRDAIFAIGPAGLVRLEEAFDDSSLPAAVRRNLPRAIREFDPARAGDILARRLPRESDGAVRFKILRALGRLRADHPNAPFDARALERPTEETLSGIFELIDWRRHLEEGAAAQPARRTAVHDLLVTLLRHKEEHALERLFRLMGLQHPGEDFRSIHRGVTNADAKARASSRELLEHVVAPRLRGPVLALVDDVGDRDRLNRAASFHTPMRASYEDVLRTLLARGGTTLRALVTYHIGELKLYGMKSAIESLPHDPADVLSETIDRTLALLAGPVPERPAGSP
ncbi:MAG: Npt1/Npt2 family nucleotide transporter [bacterium]